MATNFLPYGRQSISERDIEAVADVLRSDWLTTGPNVDAFEHEVATLAGVGHGVAVSSGTAGLHAAMFALGIGPGDEVIVPAMTFAASANVVCYCGATPIFVDISPDTLLIDPVCVKAAITDKTKAVVAVDYAGQPCDYDALSIMAGEAGIALVADACHSMGGRYKGRPVGSLADISVFSFHPVKPMTTGEGGMAMTNNDSLYQRLRLFRNHGITTDHRQRQEKGAYFYEMTELGFNYRITDIQCALGQSQLKRLPDWVERRNHLAQLYDQQFAEVNGVEPLYIHPDCQSGYHLYVIRVKNCDRDQVFQLLRDENIGVNVHYIPVYRHPYYRQRLGDEFVLPETEAAFNEILSLPLFPAMDERDIQRVVRTVAKAAS